MKKNLLSVAVKGALGLTAAAIMVPVMPAFAQEDAKLVEEVVVTGSRIKRQDLESVSPLTSIGAEEFKISGNLNVEQKLAELPQTLPSFGPSSNNPGDGTARVDLRGLGSFRTVVLVNGRRYIPSTQTGVVDLNTIPGTLIKNVDVVTGGASAVYGSDALAGVVNFQMVDDFEGVQITSLYDVTGEGDGEKSNIDLTIGGNFADGRGNAVVYASWSEREAVFADARDFTSVALNDKLIPAGSSGVPGTLDFNTGYTWDPDGSSRPFEDPADRFNYAPDNYLQLPQERWLISSFAHYDISDKLTAYGEMAFSHNEVPQELAPTPAFTSVAVNQNSPFFDDNFKDVLADLQAANGLSFFDFNEDGISDGQDVIDFDAFHTTAGTPGFTPGDGQIAFDNGFNALDTNGNGALDVNDSVGLYVGRRMVENGSRQSLDTRDAFRILAGFRGDINDDWSFDTYYSLSNLENTNLLNNDVSASRFVQAILVTDDGTACQDASGGCAPLNIFGAGNISQEAIDFVNVGATNVTNIEQEVFSASISGSLATLPTASEPVGLVFGLEHRRDESSFRPDTFLSSGDVLGFNAGQATVGSYSAKEAFTEFNVPLVDGRPGVESLSLWGAYRYSDYSNIGGVSSYATALNYAPVEMVKFRAGFQQAVRAPNVSELYLGASNGFPGATDPCAEGKQTADTDTALCAAMGGAAGSFKQQNAQIQGLFGGNPDLKEETSNTFTFGVVVEPMDGLDFTIDYFDIEIEDAIDVFGGGVSNTLDLCYNVFKDISSPYCQAITRRSDGNVSIVQVLNANIGLIETRGVDFNVNYGTDLDFGIDGGSFLDIAFNSTYLLDYDVTPVADLSERVDVCAGNYGATCLAPRQEFNWNSRITWTSGPLTLSALVRYIGETDDERIEHDGVEASSLAAPGLDAETYLDLTAGYAFTEKLDVNFGIKNALDTEPNPLGDVQSEQSNTFPSTYDMLGPRYFLSASYKFD